MSDEADRGQAAEQFFRDQAIAAASAGVHLVSTAPCSGDCTDCDRKISEARLRAVPSARRCADCQTLAERRKGAK